MSVISSLFTGGSGLASHADALSSVGDNIANSNTIGFKRARANFEDVLARSLGASGPGDVGMGSRVGQVQKIMTQGALLGTGVATDLAISGDGFFVVKGNAGGLDGSFYTRSGQFKVDADGFVVNQGGLRVQGYNADSSGNLVQSVVDLQIPTYEVAPQASTAAVVAGNVDSDAVSPTAPWDVLNAEATSNSTSSVTVYDSLGKAHSVALYFRREPAAGTWSWHAVVDGGELSGGTAGTPTEIGTGTLTFDTQGRLLTESGTITATFDNATAQTLTVDFGDSITTDGGSGLQGMTSYASPSSVSFLSQNGYPSGALSGISIEADGNVVGVFSNGTRRTVAQVLLADFQNAQDMQRIGGNLWLESTKSGSPVVGAAGASGRGVINAGSLEQSNVNLSEEFINLIAYQRGYQANSRTVTTADTMLQEALGLKR